MLAMRKRSSVVTGSSAGAVVVVVAASVGPAESALAGGSTMSGWLRVPNAAACTGTPSMLTATEKA